jgi:hypothetical protein
MKEVVVHLEVNQARGEFSASTEFGGTPICTYGPTEEEAIRRAKGAIFRFLGRAVEQGHADLEALRFKVRD